MFCWKRFVREKKKQSFLKSGENFKKKIKKINVEKKLELK